MIARARQADAAARLRGAALGTRGSGGGTQRAGTRGGRREGRGRVAVVGGRVAGFRDGGPIPRPRPRHGCVPRRLLSRVRQIAEGEQLGQRDGGVRAAPRSTFFSRRWHSFPARSSGRASDCPTGRQCASRLRAGAGRGSLRAPSSPRRGPPSGSILASACARARTSAPPHKGRPDAPDPTSHPARVRCGERRRRSDRPRWSPPRTTRRWTGR